MVRGQKQKQTPPPCPAHSWAFVAPASCCPRRRTRRRWSRPSPAENSSIKMPKIKKTAPIFLSPIFFLSSLHFVEGFSRESQSPSLVFPLSFFFFLSFFLPTSLIGPTARFGRKLGSCLPSYRHDMLGGPGPPMYIPCLLYTSPSPRD